MTDAPTRGLVAAAFALAVVMLFLRLGRPALMWPDEGRNAEVAREMSVGSSWWEPTLEGLPYLDKPVTFFAAVALSFRLLGINEWAARLPSALCGLGALVVLFSAARKRAGSAAAAAAVVTAATCPMVFAFSRLVIMDMMLAFCTVCSILAAFTAVDLDGVARARRYLVAAAMAGAGFVVKGPVGVLVPVAVLVVDRLVAPAPGSLRRLFSRWNAVVFLAIAAPWFLGVVAAHPDFFHYGVVEETLGRFFTPAFNRVQPFWFFGPVFLVATFPWCALIPAVAATVWRGRRSLAPIDRLLAVWTVVVILFFSLSRTKQPGYILSAVIAFGALTGITLVRALAEPEGRAARTIARSTLVFGAGALGIGIFLGAAATRHDLLPGRMAASLSGAEWAVPGLRWCALGAIVAGIGGIAGGWRRSARATILAYAALPAAIIVLAFPGVATYAETRSARPMARAFSALPREVEIVALSTYPSGLSFYLGRTITLISKDGLQLGSNYVAYWLRGRNSWPTNVVPWDDRAAWLDGRTHDVLLVADSYGRNELGRIAGERGAAVTELSDEWSFARIVPAGRR